MPKLWDFQPEGLFYLSGVDALAEDKLGRLALTHAGLKARDTQVIAGARQRDIPLVITLGGGYGEPIEATVAAHVNTFKTAADLYTA